MKVFVLLLIGASAPLYGQACATFRTITPLANVQSRLDASQCSLPDGSWAESFRLTLPRRGLLHVEIMSNTPGFTAIVRNSGGMKVSSGPVFDQHLESGLYTVVANAAKPGDADDYTLKTVFTPDSEDLCRYSPLLGAGTLDASNSISYQVGPASCLLPDGSRAELYRITVFGSGTLNLTLDATEFSPQIFLRSEDGYLVASNDASGGTEAVLSLPVVGSQTYTVVVAGTDASGSTINLSGAFMLSNSFLPDEDPGCRASGAFTNTQDQDGIFDSTSCNFRLPDRDDAALFRFYDVAIPQPGIAEFRLANASFSGYLLLVDAQGNTISEDRGSGDGGIPSIHQQVAPGQYRVYVFNGDSFDGNYTLSYSLYSGNPPLCLPQKIPASQQTAGILNSANDCRRSDMLSDSYTLVLPSAGQVSVQASSGDFTTRLAIKDVKDNLLILGAQTPDGYSSLASTQLPAGTYVVVIGSEDLAGGYTLSYQTTPQAMPACDSALSIPLNTAYVNIFGRENCITGDGQITDVYSFTLTDFGTVGLVMTSSTIEGLLSLYDGDGSLLRWNVDGYIGSNPAIFQYLSPGSYRILARSSLPSVGRYRVDVLYQGGLKPAFCGPKSLPLDALQTGTLDYTSCRYPDDTFAQWYQIRVNDNGQVRMQVDSKSFVPSLILLDAKGNLIDSADANGGSSTLIAIPLQSGTYYLAVKASDDGSGNGPFNVSASTSSFAQK